MVGMVGCRDGHKACDAKPVHKKLSGSSVALQCSSPRHVALLLTRQRQASLGIRRSSLPLYLDTHHNNLTHLLPHPRRSQGQSPQMDVSLKDPFWGPQTSYLNFCEEDYVVTRYVAEFINTCSSLIYILYGIYGLSQLRSKPTASFARAIPWFGLMGVGICSAGYHMTLKYHTQMSDELSMHLLTTPLVYRVLTFQVSPQWRRLIGIALALEFTTVMVVHMVMDEFLLHAVTFGAGALLIARRTMQIISQQIPNPAIKQKTRNIGRFGIFCFLFGYFAWLVDVWACNHLTRIRELVGAPVAFFFELHGWWHFFTAIGAYVAVAVVDMITSGEVHTDPSPQLAWPVSLAARLMGPDAAQPKKQH